MALGPRDTSPQEDKKQQQKNDAEQDVFVREVDDAMREESLLDFWRKYGRWVVGLLIVGVAALGGWFFWQSQQLEEAGVRSEEFVTALDAVDGGNLDGAANALEPLTQTKQAGYRAAALMMQGNIALEKDDIDTAVAKYRTVIDDDSLPQLYRDAALIRQTAAEFDRMEPSQVVDRLKPFAVPGNPWFGSAGEMVALSYMRMNKPKLAGTMFSEMAEDDNVPGTIKSRARQMAGIMGVDTIDDPEAVATGAEARGEVPSGEGR